MTRRAGRGPVLGHTDEIVQTALAARGRELLISLDA
jgi:hypothetical protein